jgi:hypothetical protein
LEGGLEAYDPLPVAVRRGSQASVAAPGVTEPAPIARRLLLHCDVCGSDPAPWLAVCLEFYDAARVVWVDVAKVRELCEARVPPDAREHVRVELERERQAVNIVERQPPWREDYGPEWSRLPIARLSYVASTRLWTLYHHRHTGRWARYPLLGPSRRLVDLLREIAEGPICVFGG